jgi:hypothetical protein
MFIKALSVFLVCLLSGCETSILQPDNANRTQQKEKAELFVNMKRSGCNGNCATYDLTIQPDGKVIFDGKSWTELVGKAESELTENQLKQLIAEIENADFFSLENAYNYDSKNCPVTASDMPGVTLHIKINEKEKTIDHDLGCWENTQQANQNGNLPEDITKKIFPQQLYILENKIDEIVETKRWTGKRK